MTSENENFSIIVLIFSHYIKRETFTEKSFNGKLHFFVQCNDQFVIFTGFMDKNA